MTGDYLETDPFCAYESVEVPARRPGEERHDP
jgi:hypothetical protein